jgi:hypothetical protein
MTAPILWWKAESSPAESQAGIDAVWNIAPVYNNGFSVNMASGDSWALSVANNALFNFVPSGDFSIRFYIQLNDTTHQNPVLFIIKNTRFGLAGVSDWGCGISNNGTLGIIAGGALRDTDYQFTDMSRHEGMITYSNGYYHAYVDTVDVTGINFGIQYLCGNNTGPLYFVQSYYSIENVDLIIKDIRLYDKVIEIDNDDTPTVDSLADLSSHPIFTQHPDWSNLPAVELGFGRDVLQSHLGRGRIRDLTSDLSRTIEYGFTEATKALEYYLLNFFCSRKGRNERFWLPTWYQSFTLSDTIVNGTYIFKCSDYHFDEVARWYERIFFYLKDGSLLTREVISANSATEFVVNTAWDRDIAATDVLYFGRLLLGRFDQDELEVGHLTDKVAEIRFKFRELAKEYSLGATES